jgi:hypothetical protein
VFGAPDVVTRRRSEGFDAPEPPDEHAANRTTDAQSATTLRPRFTITGLPETSPGLARKHVGPAPPGGPHGLTAPREPPQSPAGEERGTRPATWRTCNASAVTDRHFADWTHGLAFTPAVIRAANDVVMEIVGLGPIQLVAA